MPLYNYICNACKSAAEDVKGAPLSDEECAEVVFETKHRMSPTPAELAEASECPRCSSRRTEITMLGTSVTCYVRGYGYLDRAGVTRDMNLYKLKQDDPYGQYRVTGEVDHLESKLKRAGKHDPKTRHYVGKDPQPMERAVTQAVNVGDAFKAE